PPSRFHRTQQSVFPTRPCPSSAASRTPSTFSRIHWILPPEKYVAGGSPALRRITSPLPSRSSAEAIRSLRVSCQTIALSSARPVVLSQKTAVSRWLVIPPAARSDALRLVLVSS